jgi:LmbE family N-acetylglucosaminyl deacetylase
VRETTPAGHAPAVWAATLRRAPALRLPRTLTRPRTPLRPHVLVAAAHADDETLGAAGLIGALRARGARFTVVVATDGAAAFPGLPANRRRELAATRRAETHAALGELGIGNADTHFLGLPDGEAADHVDTIGDALKSLGAECDLWMVPWRDDPHPDHRAVGEAARSGEVPPSLVIEYPVWMRHGRLPSSVSRENLRVHRLSPGQARRKQRAIAAHTSQITIWEEGHLPVLPRGVTALFRDRLEPFFVPAGTPAGTLAGAGGAR